jgi:hypothetical protein
MMHKRATHGYADKLVENPMAAEPFPTRSVKKWEEAHPTKRGAQKCPPTIPVPRLSPVTKILARAIAAEQLRLKPEFPAPS